MKIDRDKVKEMVDFLNSVHMRDPAAMHSLINVRVPCKPYLAYHPTVICNLISIKRNQSWVVGLLGILNGFCGHDELGGGIQAVLDDGVLQGFQVRPDLLKPECPKNESN